MTLRKTVPLLNISDMADSLAFYGEGLGFEIVETWKPEGEIRWCQIERDGSALMLQTGSVPEGQTRGAGISLCIFCDDAIALYREFLSRGVKPDEPVVGNRLWVTSVADPDGFRIDFESPTDVEEETRLSDWEARQ